MSWKRLPDRVVDDPMTKAQADTLRSLSDEAYQPNQFAKDLSAAEATERINALRREIELANSF